MVKIQFPVLPSGVFGNKSQSKTSNVHAVAELLIEYCMGDVPTEFGDAGASSDCSVANVPTESFANNMPIEPEFGDAGASSDCSLANVPTEFGDAGVSTGCSEAEVPTESVSNNIPIELRAADAPSEFSFNGDSVERFVGVPSIVPVGLGGI